jgi:hypothetical protein
LVGGEGGSNNKVHLGKGERRLTIEGEGEKSSDGRILWYQVENNWKA